MPDKENVEFHVVKYTGPTTWGAGPDDKPVLASRFSVTLEISVSRAEFLMVEAEFLMVDGDRLKNLLRVRFIDAVHSVFELPDANKHWVDAVNKAKGEKDDDSKTD